jgi:hypothetical protein
MKKLAEVRKNRQCPIHRQWLRKGNCELCIMEREAKKKEYEKLTGSNKPAIFIKKL